MTFLQLIGLIGAFTVFVLVSWWCFNHDCSNNKQWQEAMDRLTGEKFPHHVWKWKVTHPTTDKYLLQKLIELEQEIKELKEEFDKLRKIQ